MKERATAIDQKSQKLLSMLDFVLFPFAGEIETLGLSSIKEKLQLGPIIFATTHLSGQDVTIVVREFLRNFSYPFLIARASTHSSLGKPFHYLSENFFGEKYFANIETIKERGKEKGVFSLENFVPISQATRDGKNIVIAGYYLDNPNYCNNGQINATLPPRLGVAAPIISILSGRPVVPVTVEMMGSGLRPKTKISFGEIISPREIGEEESRMKIKDLLQGRRKDIKEMSYQIAQQMAAMLPVEKRGTWGQI